MRPVVVGRALQQAGRRTVGLLVDERVVEEEQRLRRHGGRSALGGAGVGVGAVEQGEERVALVPLRHQVDAAAVGLVDGARTGCAA